MFTKIEMLCKEAGISMYQLSKDTGISQQTLSICKKREGNLSVDNLKKIAERFGKPMEFFIKEGV